MNLLNKLNNFVILADLEENITKTTNDLTSMVIRILSGILGGFAIAVAIFLLLRILIVFFTQYKGDDKGAEQMAQAKQKIKSLAIAVIICLAIGGIGISAIFWVSAIFNNMGV